MRLSADLLVALSDKLWKGKRAEALQEQVLRSVSLRTGRDLWALYAALDAIFEEVASGAEGRLLRSDV